MRLALKLLLASVVALLLGAVLLAKNLSNGLDAMSVRNGDWTTSVTTGASDAGLISRAAVSIGGLLASTRENSIYYRLAALAGEPLRLNCSYRVRGGYYDASWWSITAYGWDHYLIPNAARRFSFNNENIQRDGAGSWQIIVSASPQPGNWLPVGEATGERRTGGSDFDLLLRLYTPGDAYLQTPDSAPLPTVEREGCE